MKSFSFLNQFSLSRNPGSSSRLTKRLAILALALAPTSLAFAGPIHDAARKGDLKRVQALLQADPTLVNSKDNMGDTPLHVAALHGELAVAQALIAAGADINAKNLAGPFTPGDLWDVISGQNHPDPVRLLTVHGIIQADMKNGYTPLDMAAFSIRYMPMVKFLVDKGADVNAETLLGANYPGGGTVADAITHAIATIGENMTLRRAAGLSVAEGAIGSYVHAQAADGLGRIGVLVAVESKGDKDKLAALARQIAMHIAATSPSALHAEGLDPAVIAREKSVLEDKNAGKPPHVLAKIVESGLKTFYKEVCLVDQAFVHDPAKSVAVAVKEAEKSVGAPIAIHGYVRYALGEGVEKPAEEA